MICSDDTREVQLIDDWFMSHCLADGMRLRETLCSSSKLLFGVDDTRIAENQLCEFKQFNGFNMPWH